MKTVVRNVEYFGVKFVIVKDEEERFWGFEEQYVSKYDNKLLKGFNGITGRMSETIEECMKKCMRDANVQYLKSKGINDFVAVMMATTGKTEQEVTEMLGGNKNLNSYLKML